MGSTTAVAGVTEHGNSAFLVTVTAGGQLLDRRHVDLTGPELPTHPHHHEGSWAVGRYLNTPGARRISMPEAVALVELVREAADRGAHAHLAALAASVPVPIVGITLRICPELPATIEERIRDVRAQTYADTVMYRQCLAKAAADRGWRVRWYDRDRVFDEAAAILDCEDLNSVLAAMGRGVGAPWQAPHKLAAAAALAAARD